MDGIVAKRTLKKSYGAHEIPYIHTYGKEKKEKKKRFLFKEKILFKLSIQTVTTLAILSFALAVKFLNIDVVKNSEIINDLKIEWNKNYTYREIKEQTTSFLKDTYIFVKPIIPTKVEALIKEGITKLKHTLKNNKNDNGVVNLYKEEVNIYEETNNSESENKEIVEVPDNVGTSVEEEKVITAESSLSYQDEIASNIKEQGITFIKPVSGSITSNFGAREVIFEGVDSYHTGTDIGAKSGTKVVSSISGTVTVATYNQYNGNYIEVTNGDVVTKYLHLSKISVKKGAKINRGEKIGEVGSTGLSTGPHLHFEVVYKGTKIDPRLVVDL